MENKPKINYKRTTQEQLQWYIAFVKSHPKLMAAKNSTQLWDEVANNLNSLPGPTRTPAKWKESLANWKKQLRCRVRKNKLSRPAATHVIKALRMRVDHSIPEQEELGFEEIICPTASIDFDVVAKENCTPILSSSPECTSNAFFRSDGSMSSTTTEASFSRAKKKRASKELVDTILAYIIKREEHDEQALAQQVRTNDALLKLGEGLLAFAHAIKSTKNNQ